MMYTVLSRHTRLVHESGYREARARALLVDSRFMYGYTAVVWSTHRVLRVETDLSVGPGPLQQAAR